MDEIVGTLEVPRWILAEKEAKAAVAGGQTAGEEKGEKRKRGGKASTEEQPAATPEDKAAAPVEQAPSRKSLEKMTVPQLKAELKARGKPDFSGKKSDLVDRLLTTYAKAEEAETAATPSAEAGKAEAEQPVKRSRR